MIKLSEIVFHHKRRRTAIRALASIDKATGVEVDLEFETEMNWLAFFNIQKPENIKAVLAILKTESEQALAESEAWLSANGIVADVDPTADKDP